MPFTAADIHFTGQLPNNTACSYVVTRDGEQIGQVNVGNPLWIANTGEDVLSYVARTLTDYEARMDPDEFQKALDGPLSL